MGGVNLWEDLLGEQKIVSRNEIEFEIAFDNNLLEKREALIWKLFDADSQYNAIRELEQLYQGVVTRIEEEINNGDAIRSQG